MDTPIDLEGRRLKEMGVKISTNINEIIDHSLYGKPLLRLWSDINNLPTNQYKQIDWKALKVAALSSPSNRHIWAVSLNSKELPTCYMMEIRGMWPFSHCPREFGHTPETVLLFVP